MTGASKATALIAAAGSGERLGAGGPKAFVELAGRRMVEWSIEAFAASRSTGSVVVAVPEGHVREAERGRATVVAGGATRSESVARALAQVGSEIVVVHDAARPLVTPELIDAVVGELSSRSGLAGVIAAAPVTDTVKEADQDRVVERTLDRERLWAVQTPQAFRTDALRDAHAAGDLAAATDDAMLVEQAGGKVGVYQAPPGNLKVTTPLDLKLAELLLARR